MVISGIQKLTLLDYPDHTACIVFTAGCNFRCRYCHNPEFVLPEQIKKMKGSFIPEESFFSFLEGRKGKIEGVVISGGEPTMMRDLVEFAKKIKDMGFLVKLDTNGNNPILLQQLLHAGVLDYIAMDIKTSLEQYHTLVGGRADPTLIKESAVSIIQSGIPYEFRSTLIQEIHTPEVREGMYTIVNGSDKYFLQSFRPGKTLHPLFATYHPFSNVEMNNIAEEARAHATQVIVRM